MRCQLIISALLGLFLTFHININDAVVFKFTNFVCESYNQSSISSEGRQPKQSAPQYEWDDTTSDQQYVNSCQNFQKANGYKPWLVDIYFDFCQYFRKRNQPVFNIIYGLFKQFSNINHSCPYVGPQIIKDFYLIPELLRVPMPTGDYLLALQWYFDKNH